MNPLLAFTSSPPKKKIFFFYFLFFSHLVFSQAGKDRPLRLFMIGNSFSQNASQYLPQLSKEGGHPLVLGRAVIGGSSLQQHWQHAEAAERNPEDPKGKPYAGKSLRMLLSEGEWDVITIQQASIVSGNVNTYRPYARQLYDYVKKLQPNAQVVMHQTWAYRIDSKDYTQIGKGESAKSAREMYEYSRAAYHTIAGELGIPIIPTGDAFWAINSSKKWGYQADSAVHYQQSQNSALPLQKHSLHVGYFRNQDKSGFDSHHANEAGCYLGGLVWYSFLFGESPKKLTFHPASVDDSFAKQLRKTAWKVVKKEKPLHRK